MYYGSIETGKIIEAFRRFVPGVYVRDYREKGGFITVCRDYKDLTWGDQQSAPKVYKQVPAVTLCNLPRGYTGSATRYRGLRLERTGWRIEFRRAMNYLTEVQQRAITEFLGVGEVFPGIVVR
jgi:hypothetical protein